ncbi:hypothetical protein KUV85_08870 [Nocardioides panacisoli]|uniref:hypothetical protein n=1 Tax=Nocardioides panacisoli TaxID=627624 RepID=UPI001C62B5B6|nr:hypothetical protein KUV85_08870 [Nocardioides panacisoli]
MHRRIGVILFGLAALSLVAAVGIGVIFGAREITDRINPECTVTVGEHTAKLQREQAENASLITAIARQRGMPARAASIALATAYQESDLYNIDHGDRDSIGLFQQRPSQGWGTEEQIMDPVYATNAFYDALAKVDGYESMVITEAAQEVQRSAFPGAYADHEDDARAIASALTGNSPEALTCRAPSSVDSADATLTSSGLTPRAETIRREVQERFGDQQVGGFAPGGVSEGHMEGSAHYDGRAVDVFFRPVNERNKVRGWAMAQYFVANAERLQVSTVIYDDRIWTARRSDEGWRDYDVPSSSGGDRAILEHRDHVHVDVFA